MKGELFGPNQSPAVAVVGSWDPFIDAHRQLMGQLSQYARSCELTSLVILLHPNPSTFIHGIKDWPIYDDTAARIARIQACGVDSVIVIRFTKRDVDRGAKELFELVQLHIKLDELWLGPRQSLGPGPGGSSVTIAQLSEQQKIRLERLPESDSIKDSYRARRLLSEGRPQKSIQFSGHPPVWRRPKSNVIKLPWPGGEYLTVALENPLDPAVTPTIDVNLVSKGNGYSELVWPDKSIEWLAFVKGPGDNEDLLE